MSLGGFSRLRALSTAFNDRPAQASRPFDVERDGFVMGEGAGVLVLEERGHALARGATVYAEVCHAGVIRTIHTCVIQVVGAGASADAYHMTQPPADGEGAALAMHRALRCAGAVPEDVVYLNAHATSTPIGDDVEQTAIARVFGAHGTEGGLKVSSTKGATGHLLGAAGAVEAVFAVLAVHHRRAPGTVNLTNPDPALLGGLLMHGENASLPSGGLVMSNSFGFGGTNTSLVFAPAE